jgi:formylglycine-generating enzyme
MPARRMADQCAGFSLLLSLVILMQRAALAQTDSPRRIEPLLKPAVTSFSLGTQPERLVAPFDAGKASTARRAWARYQAIGEEEVNSIGMKLTLIPPGEFQMGSTAEEIDQALRLDPLLKKDLCDFERPQHRVKITRPIYLGTYEVTKGQFRKFIDETAYKTDAEKDGKGCAGYTGEKNQPFNQRVTFTWRKWGIDLSDETPVVNVSHNDAAAFCEWLSKKDRKSYRLPTEAEWEYACRAGTTSLYYNGNDPEALTKIGNIADASARKAFSYWNWTLRSTDGRAFLAPVGQFQPNNFGIYDMVGNAWEWCADWDGTYDTISPKSDPFGPVSGTYRMSRGGGWGSAAGSCRSANRGWLAPDFRTPFLGFRVAVVPAGR